MNSSSVPSREGEQRKASPPTSNFQPRAFSARTRMS